MKPIIHRSFFFILCRIEHKTFSEKKETASSAKKSMNYKKNPKFNNQNSLINNKISTFVP